MNFCDPCQWETNERVYQHNGDTICETCMERYVRAALDDLFNTLGYALPESIWERSLEIAA